MLGAKIGQKVFVREIGKRGKVAKIDSNGKVSQVIIDDEIVEVTSMIVVAWKSLRWIVRFFIKLFSRRG